MRKVFQFDLSLLGSFAERVFARQSASFITYVAIFNEVLRRGTS